MPKVKGPAIIGARDWLDERLGPGFHNQIAREIDPDFPERILPGEWYPIAPLFHVLEVAVERLDGFDSVEQLVEQLGSLSARQDLRGIYRAFLWAASPKMFLRASRKIWANYADFGTIAEMDNETGHFVARITQIPAPYVGWLAGAWKGFLPPAVELAGGKNSRATVLERRPSGDGSWEIRFQLDYE